jgi:hypothetical protein
LTGKAGVRNVKEINCLCFQNSLILYKKMMKEEIEEEKIDIETPFLLTADYSPGELNEK